MNRGFRFVRAGLLGCALGFGVLGSGGCALSESDRLVGVYSIDPELSEIPDIPLEGFKAQFRELRQNTKLKLLSDRHFVLVGARVVEGTWALDSGVVHFEPAKDAKETLLLGPGKVEAKVTSDRPDLVLERETPFGRFKIYLRKTG